MRWGLVAVLLAAVACERNVQDKRRERADSSKGTGVEVAAPPITNPIYPIEVSISGNGPLQEAAAAAEARSRALDEICKGLQISAALAPQQPAGGGCPRYGAPWGAGGVNQ